MQFKVWHNTWKLDVTTRFREFTEKRLLKFYYLFWKIQLCQMLGRFKFYCSPDITCRYNANHWYWDYSWRTNWTDAAKQFNCLIKITDPCAILGCIGYVVPVPCLYRPTDTWWVRWSISHHHLHFLGPLLFPSLDSADWRVMVNFKKSTLMGKWSYDLWSSGQAC